jgi:hypothetical protein
VNLNEWNIQDLLNLQMQVNAEIAARVKAVEQMENSFHTYNPNGKPEDYKTLMETGVELLRKGVKK